MTFNLKRIHKAVNWNKEDDGFTQAFWEQNVKQFWLPEEISVSKDLKCWSMLSEKEKELYKKVLAGLTLLYTKQGNLFYHLWVQWKKFMQRVIHQYL